MLLNPVPWTRGHCLPWSIHGYSSDSPVRYIWWLCAPPQTSPIPKMAQHHTFWYLYTWSFWVCVCLRPQNLWLCLSRWLGHPSLTFLHVSKHNPPLRRPYLLDTCGSRSTCEISRWSSLQYSLYRSITNVRRCKQSMLPLTKGLGSECFPPIFSFLFYTQVKETFLCILRDPAAVRGFISIQSTSQAGDFVVPIVCIWLW